MRVLLVNPDWDSRVSVRGRRHNRAWPPLDLLNCAAILESQAIEVSVLDARAEPIQPEFLNRTAPAFDLVMLTSSPLDRWQCPNLDLRPFLKWASQVDPEHLYILGVHGTLWPEQMLTATGAKVVVRGEPESVVQAIGRGMDLEKIEGVSFRNRRGEVVHNPDSKQIDMAAMVQPAYHLVRSQTYEYELLGDRLALLEVSRGCPYQCRFCLKKMYGAGLRHKEVSQVVAELDSVVRKCGFRRAYFIDLDFAWNRELAVRLCDALVEKKVDFHWCCQTRADRVDRKLLSTMFRAGCRLIHFGIESASDRVLEAMAKTMDLGKVERGVRLAQEEGLETACFFMFGYPGETNQEMEATLALAKRLNPTYASFHAVTTYPGTALFRDTMDEDDAFSVDGRCLETQALDPFLRRAYLSYYLRPQYVVERIRQRNFGGLWRQARLFWDYIRG
ncbi:MAG: radical SAM protein [Deltaproteobacteria bacterium]|nr:MAG: radical SAM protein [Deltaproteobacteria bacterium]